ncbi:hypothetical protein L209DRAFT_384688 [Thermothelomyces heterothallicus CBS 203.75]
MYYIPPVSGSKSGTFGALKRYLRYGVPYILPVVARQRMHVSGWLDYTCGSGYSLALVLSEAVALPAQQSALRNSRRKRRQFSLPPSSTDHQSHIVSHRRDIIEAWLRLAPCQAAHPRRRSSRHRSLFPGCGCAKDTNDWSDRKTTHKQLMLRASCAILQLGSCFLGAAISSRLRTRAPVGACPRNNVRTRAAMAPWLCCQTRRPTMSDLLSD